MNVIKRSGMEVLFDKNKIVNAITKAKKDTPTSNITKEAMRRMKLLQNCLQIYVLRK